MSTTAIICSACSFPLRASTPKPTQWVLGAVYFDTIIWGGTIVKGNEEKPGSHCRLFFSDSNEVFHDSQWSRSVWPCFSSDFVYVSEKNRRRAFLDNVKECRPTHVTNCRRRPVWPNRPTQDNQAVWPWLNTWPWYLDASHPSSVVCLAVSLPGWPADWPLT